MVSKIVGYLIAAAGLAITLFSFNLSMFNVTLPSAIKPVFITIAGVAVIILGAVLSMNKGSGKYGYASEELPVYHKNKIVGYRRVK